MSELMTKPITNGEVPGVRRTPRGLLPGTWVGHTVRVEYLDAYGEGAKTSGALSDLFGFGPVLRAATGEKWALSWDAIRTIELVEEYTKGR
jgi:hypothetical protein